MAATQQIDRNLSAVENELGFDSRGEAFMVTTPQSLCCNCGIGKNLSATPTHYVQASKFSTNFDDRLWFELTLPYCATCVTRVNKHPAWGAMKAVIGFALWLALCMGSAMLIGTNAPPWLRWIPLILPVIVVVLAFRWFDRPRAPMTAKYFPVKIKEFSGHPQAVRYVGISAFVLSGIAYVVGLIANMISGKNPHAIDKLTLTFSNPDYAVAFAKLNRDHLRRGSVHIKNLPTMPKDRGEQKNDAKADIKPAASKREQPKMAPRLPQGQLTFGDFSDWFVSNAQAYCDGHDQQESGDDVTLSTHIQRVGLRPAKVGENKPRGAFELSLAMVVTVKYHDAPATSNLNDKGMEALALINAMRENAGGVEKMTWWLWFVPDAQGGTAGWRFLDGEVQGDGATARETIEDTEWIVKSMSELTTPKATRHAWEVQQQGSIPIVGVNRDN